MKLFLAPMEGVVDFTLRHILTQLGGIDQCVTEFMRVTDKRLPDSVFYRYCPELFTQSKTAAGTPIYFQLLGGQAGPLAENAHRVAELGAAGVDLNFGCPAKTVNRHDGGATLLKTPERIFHIVSTVRAATPTSTPVTAKIRLGFDDPALCIANALAAEQGGAQWITVHARTKVHGYAPPAYWEWIPRIREHVKIPIIANGEVWSVEDYHRCREISQSQDVMIGRGAVADPYLFLRIRQSLDAHQTPTPAWPDVQLLLPGFFRACEAHRSGEFALARTKQWLKAMSLRHEPAKEIFNQLKVLTEPQLFRDQLESLC